MWDLFVFSTIYVEVKENYIHIQKLDRISDSTLNLIKFTFQFVRARSIVFGMVLMNKFQVSFEQKLIGKRNYCFCNKPSSNI